MTLISISTRSRMPKLDPPTALSSSDRMEALARRVECLSPSRHDPEKFFEERSEIAHDLRREATQLARDGA